MDLETAKIIAGALKYIAAGLGVIALGGVGSGVGSIFASFINEVSRNPGAKKQLFTYALIGLALTEAIGLYALVIVFIILFA
ncbi:UNVERIFIED_CONTAM: hypothetical protein PYX00_011118 [Menopon gallinae]|uniref:ATPase protein 9 n=1 Tax=Menopon gallinae TaxID=328185 RepID=A0AAW2H604_9NEOP